MYICIYIYMYIYMYILSKLFNIVTTFHDKEALVLVPESLVSNVCTLGQQQNSLTTFQGHCH